MRKALFAFMLAACSGCGDNTVTVTGSVSLDGKPADEGSVSFQPADGKGPSGGGKVADGQFEVKGLAPGKYKVMIRAALKTGKKIPAGPPTPPGTMMDEMIQYPGVSKEPEAQTVEVVAGMQPLAYDLKSPAKK